MIRDRASLTKFLDDPHHLLTFGPYSLDFTFSLDGCQTGIAQHNFTVNLDKRVQHRLERKLVYAIHVLITPGRTSASVRQRHNFTMSLDN